MNIKIAWSFQVLISQADSCFDGFYINFEIEFGFKWSFRIEVNEGMNLFKATICCNVGVGNPERYLGISNLVVLGEYRYAYRNEKAE